MYKVMIVDDEVLARVGIKSLIDWGQHGFEVVGEAENGEKALKLAAETMPDIIITDIKMPMMNGVELIREAVLQEMDIRFIVLSSYDDFQYVKEAMRAGAEDYLIKLELQPEQLLEVLNSLKPLIDKDRAGKEEKPYPVHLERSLSILRDNFLRELLIGRNYSREEVTGWAREYGLHLHEEQIVCYAIQPDSFEVYNKYTHEDVHLLDFAMLNVVEEILPVYIKGYAVQTADREISVLITCSKGESLKREELHQLEASIIHAMKTYLNISVTMGLSGIHKGYPSIRQAYREASTAVARRFSFPPGSTISYDEVRDFQTVELELKEEMKELEKALLLEDPERVAHWIGTINGKIHATPYVSRENAAAFCSALLYMTESVFDGRRPAGNSSASREVYLHQKLSQISSLADLSLWFVELEEVLTEIMVSANESSRLIRSVKGYIQEHYSEEISLEILAHQMNISPNYLSNLFKKETGENLIEHVTRVRIGRAAELLKTTDLKIYEIGKRVGYENEHYFSRVFKKVTGISPNRYRA